MWRIWVSSIAWAAEWDRVLLARRRWPRRPGKAVNSTPSFPTPISPSRTRLDTALKFAGFGPTRRSAWPTSTASLQCGAEVAGFGTGLVALVSALNTDHDWLREHTRYLRLAKEWGAIGKATDRRLLSARDIALAKAWTGSRPGKARH